MKSDTDSVGLLCGERLCRFWCQLFRNRGWPRYRSETRTRRPLRKNENKQEQTIRKPKIDIVYVKSKQKPEWSRPEWSRMTLKHGVPQRHGEVARMPIRVRWIPNTASLGVALQRAKVPGMPFK